MLNLALTSSILDLLEIRSRSCSIVILVSVFVGRCLVSRRSFAILHIVIGVLYLRASYTYLIVSSYVVGELRFYVVGLSVFPLFAMRIVASWCSSIRLVHQSIAQANRV